MTPRMEVVTNQPSNQGSRFTVLNDLDATVIVDAMEEEHRPDTEGAESGERVRREHLYLNEGNKDKVHLNASPLGLAESLQPLKGYTTEVLSQAQSQGRAQENPLRCH